MGSHTLQTPYVVHLLHGRAARRCVWPSERSESAYPRGRLLVRRTGIDEDTFLEEPSRHTEGLLVVSYEEGDDWCRGIADLEAELAEAVEAV